MNRERIWTVVRCADGYWTYGGKPEDYSEYEGHEIYRVAAFTGRDAVRKAQSKRRRNSKPEVPHD